MTTTVAPEPRVVDADPTVRRWVVAALVLVVILFATDRHVDPDLWGHVLYGGETLDHGLQRVDPYSYSEPVPAPWRNHEWLAEVAMALAYRAGGAAGLWALQALLGSAAGLIGLWLIRGGCSGLLESALLSFLFAISLATGISVRPQLFTFFFFALMLGIFHRRKHGGRDATPLLPFVMLAWVNAHGGFLAGLGIYGLFEAAEAYEEGFRPTRAWRKRGAILALTALATLANPYGLDLFPMLLRSIEQVAVVTEWRPIGLTLENAAPLTLLGVALFSLALTRRPRRPYQVAFLLVTGFLACRHVRHVPLFALAAAACVPEHLASALRERLGWLAGAPPASPAGRKAVLASLGLCGAVLLARILGLNLDRPFGLGSEPGEYPQCAVRLLERREIQGNLLAFFNWAQYALWHLNPRMRVFFDGRFRTVYGEQVERDYLDFQYAAPGTWSRALEAYDTEWVLIPRSLPAAREMDRREGWVVCYRDATTVLYGKASSPDVTQLREAIGDSGSDAGADEEITWFP